jgi:uncharacterized protein involved in type VI secretion and phage assembly
MQVDLLKLFKGDLDLESADEKTRFYGITLGIVTDLDDPEHLGRVQVRFPYLSDEVESGWARITTPWAGQQRGSYFLPEVDDEVTVAFHHGDMRSPYILGCLWSEKATPPVPDPNLKQRALRSKSGHMIVFDDMEGAENLTFKSQLGHRVVLDDTSGAAKITIADSTGNFSVVIDPTSQKISVTSTGGQLSLEALKVTIHGQSVEVNSDGSLVLKAGGAVTLNGTAVKIN